MLAQSIFCPLTDGAGSPPGGCSVFNTGYSSKKHPKLNKWSNHFKNCVDNLNMNLTLLWKKNLKYQIVACGCPTYQVD